MFRTAHLAALALTCSLASAQGVTVAVDDGTGQLDLWRVLDGSPSAALEHSGVTLLDVRLGGYPLMARLRRDLPRRADAARVDLPDCGSLYRVRTSSATGILHARGDGDTTMLISVADAGGTAGLRESLHVCATGALAMVATSFEAGGDVYVLDLLHGAPPLCLTAGIDPLDVNDKSLRISSSSAWFAAHPAIDPLTRWLDEFGTRIAGDPLWSESDRAALSDEELMALQAIGYAK